jgi:hypothetical protein
LGVRVEKFYLRLPSRNTVKKFGFAFAEPRIKERLVELVTNLFAAAHFESIGGN